jgi:hypothetical protein
MECWTGVDIMIRIKNINQNNAIIESGSGGRGAGRAPGLPAALEIRNRLLMLRKVRQIALASQRALGVGPVETNPIADQRAC